MDEQDAYAEEPVAGDAGAAASDVAQRESEVRTLLNSDNKEQALKICLGS